MKSVGIIGGLGPETSAEFYLELVFGCQKIDTNCRPLIMMSNVPLPFALERDFIKSNKGIERFIPYLVTEAQRLEKTGVDFLVMPCNSLHIFIEQIRESVKIPVLSILEETVEHIKTNRFRKIGLISTSATIKNKIYENTFAQAGIEFIVPDELQRAEMDKIILRLIEGIHLNKDRNIIHQVIESLKQEGADAIALACTDLQLLLPSDDEVKVFDTMKILANATIENLLC